MKKKTSPDLHLGWKEWVDLPELGILLVKAKLDTGARTSALHAIDVQPFERDGQQYVTFTAQPNQRDSETTVSCTAPVKDQRTVKDSGGHRELRWVIETPVTVGDQTWPIELTLTDRSTMRFRLLLGRTAIRGRAVVDPSNLFLAGKRRKKQVTS